MVEIETKDQLWQKNRAWTRFVVGAERRRAAREGISRGELINSIRKIKERNLDFAKQCGFAPNKPNPSQEENDYWAPDRNPEGCLTNLQPLAMVTALFSIGAFKLWSENPSNPALAYAGAGLAGFSGLVFLATITGDMFENHKYYE